MLDAEPQVVAMGVNCVPPALVGEAVRALASVSHKPILAYPNSGEQWNAVRRCWEGAATRFTAHVPEWLAAGASWIGGCCRTTPADIRRLRTLVDA
jgi:homocysteine S-methyltransferase